MNDTEKARLQVMKMVIFDSDIVTNCLPKCEKYDGKDAGQQHGVCDCVDANEGDPCKPCAAEIAFRQFKKEIDAIGS